MTIQLPPPAPETLIANMRSQIAQAADHFSAFCAAIEKTDRIYMEYCDAFNTHPDPAIFADIAEKLKANINEYIAKYSSIR